MFSMLYNKVEKRKEWLDCAVQGGEFLKKYGYNGDYNWYFSLDRSGRPLVEPYNIFSYTFAAMAFGQLSLATGNQEYADIARKTFDIILSKVDNPKGKWNKLHLGTRNLKNFALPMILCNLAMEIEHILGKDKILYRTIKADRLSSIILWGPPGCGKTSLAKVISNTTKYKFKKINAVSAGIGDIKSAVEEAQNMLLNPSGKCILFIDEIHRFNKLQQDALLPYVENGTVILIGATTENPYFEVNKALISRSMIFKLNPLTKENIFTVLKKSLQSPEGLGNYNIKIEDETLLKIADTANGDVRTALNGLEVAVLTTSVSGDGYIHITNEIAADSVQNRKALFD